MLEVIVDGIVGVGKTTLVEILSEELDLIPFYEMSDEKRMEVRRDTSMQRLIHSSIGNNQ